MTERAVVEIMFGSQSFERNSAKANVLLLEQTSDGETKSLFPSKVLTKHGMGSKELAARDGDGRHGEWYRHSLIAEDGKVMFFTGSVTFNRKPVRDIGLLVRLRATGPFVHAYMILRPHENAVFDRIPLFSGRADVLTPEELLDMGYALKSSVIENNFDEEELEDGLVIEQMGTAIEERPVLEMMQTASGAMEAIEVPPEPKRKLRRRRL